jgi:hypothetical protein
VAECRWHRGGAGTGAVACCGFGRDWGRDRKEEVSECEREMDRRACHTLNMQ